MALTGRPSTIVRRLNRGRRLWASGDYRTLLATLSPSDQAALDLWLLYMEDGGHEANERLGPTARLIAAR